MPDSGPTRAYRGPKGELLLYVRHEERHRDGEGVLLVGVRNRIVFTIFVPEGTEIDGDLVNDTAGRTEARIHYLEREIMECERDATVYAMKQAVEWLSPTQVADLRTLYGKKLMELDALATKTRQVQ